ncbi:MAG: glycosyltransferase [Actinomycetota bacterium]|nr:glycosyltransferase [Actinomycetota bacterium]
MVTIAVVPAYNNSSTIAATVTALRDQEAVDDVVVVDDGSADDTAASAAAARARVIRMGSNQGKHAALERGMEEAAADILLMVDGDTGPTAAAPVALIEPVAAGVADMAVAILPSAGTQGGFGLVRNTASRLVRLASGFDPLAPMSGQRALTREVFEACRPFAFGFGVDAALTSDAVAHGFKVVEVPVDMSHDHRGRSLAGFVHRAKQGLHLLRSFVPRIFAARFGPSRKDRLNRAPRQG